MPARVAAPRLREMGSVAMNLKSGHSPSARTNDMRKREHWLCAAGVGSVPLALLAGTRTFTEHAVPASRSRIDADAATHRGPRSDTYFTRLGWTIGDFSRG